MDGHTNMVGAWGSETGSNKDGQIHIEEDREKKREMREHRREEERMKGKRRGRETGRQRRERGKRDRGREG